MKKILYSFLILAVSATSCTLRTTEVGTTADSVRLDTATLVLRVRETSRLHTAEYRVHKIVTHRDVKRLRGNLLGHRFEAPLTLGDRKIAIPIDVTLRAYVDMSGFSERNIERTADGDYIHVILPDPKIEVVSSRVDHARTRQYADLLRSAYTDEEMADFTRQGVEAVVRAIPEMGIFDTARQSAAATLIPIIAAMGYDESRIIVTFRKEQFTAKDMRHIVIRRDS